VSVDCFAAIGGHAGNGLGRRAARILKICASSGQGLGIIRAIHVGWTSICSKLSRTGRPHATIRDEGVLLLIVSKGCEKDSDSYDNHSPETRETKEVSRRMFVKHTNISLGHTVSGGNAD
jgi:hypothetical protein